MYERLESLTREVSRLWGMPYRYNASMLGKGESIIANYRRLRFHTPMHPSRACGAALVQHCELITSLALFYERSTRTRYTARNALVVLLSLV